VNYILLISEASAVLHLLENGNGIFITWWMLLLGGFVVLQYD